MPTVPESPRRSVNTAGGNPVKNDPQLMVLMERLELVHSHDEFQNWKANFLERFEFFLGEQGGSEEARAAYENFRQSRMETVVKKVERLSVYQDNGDVSVDRVSVRARNAMNEVSVVLLDTSNDIRGLVPPTTTEEDRAGYTKYHLGAVLVSDGFQEYERMETCRRIMDQLRDDCVEQIGDEKLLIAIRKYDDEVSRFVSIMEDLGLYKIMLKGREFDPNMKEKLKTPKESMEDDSLVPDSTPLLLELPFMEGLGNAAEDLACSDEQIATGTDGAEGAVVDDQPPETPKSEEQRRRSSRSNYDVKGSWGGMPMDLGNSSSSSLIVKQDLANSPKKKPIISPTKKKKQQEQELIMSPRHPKNPATTYHDNDDSSGGELQIPQNLVTEAVVDGDDAGSVTDRSVIETVGDKSSTPETGRVLETDTPRTKKKKMEWLSVKNIRGKMGAIGNKEGKSKPKKDTLKSPKPPRPVTKELTTKTQDKGWNMPVCEDADASSVWSRSGPPTPTGSKSRVSVEGKSLNMMSNDVPTIGPGIKVRRVSHPKTDPEPVEENEAKVKCEERADNTENVPKEEREEEAQDSSYDHASEDVQPEVMTDEFAKGSELLQAESELTAVVVQQDEEHGTTHHHATNTTVHHYKNIEENELYETVHRTVKTTHEIDHVHCEPVKSGRIVQTTHSGIDWLGTVPAGEVGEVVHDSGYYVTGSVRRESSIRMITFCGIDDTIDPRLLGIISQCYPLVEFAVLMRQEMAGQPRYTSSDYLQRLARVQAKSEGKMNLSAHLCGAFVEEILRGNDEILARLTAMQFRRVQLNATSPYGVNTQGLETFVDSFIRTAKQHSDLEISIQANDDNRAFWQGVVDAGDVPMNVTLLLDSSMGRGEVPESWPTGPASFRVGYAGGIGLGGKHMTQRLLTQLLGKGHSHPIWVSMESSTRGTKNGKDVFDLEKCFEIIDAAHECKIHSHPSFVN